MMKQKILLIILLWMMIPVTSSHALDMGERTKGERFSDWVATFGKSRQESHAVLSERKALRNREKLQRRAKENRQIAMNRNKKAKKLAREKAMKARQEVALKPVKARALAAEKAKQASKVLEERAREIQKTAREKAAEMDEKKAELIKAYQLEGTNL